MGLQVVHGQGAILAAENGIFFFPPGQERGHLWLKA